MTKFDISSNDLCAEGTKLLAAALKGNQIVTELNIPSNNMTYGSAWGDMSGIIALANVISDMGALSLLNLTDNSIGGARVKRMKEMCGSRNISLLIN